MWQFINGQLVWVKNPANFRGGRFNQFKIHGEGEGGSGSGDGQGAPDPAALQAQLKTMQDSMAKLDAKNKELLGENKSMRETTKAWEGLDPTSVRSMLEKFEGDEELKLISQGKHDEVFKKRSEKIEATFQAQIKTLQEKLDGEKKRGDTNEERVKKLIIDTNVVTKFVAAKGLESAMDDVVSRAHQVFKIEDGEAVPRDPKTGAIMQGKDGIMTQEEWIETLRISAPHLFPAGESGKPKGSTFNGSTSDIDLKIEAARKAGDTNEMRRLKQEKMKAGQRR